MSRTIILLLAFLVFGAGKVLAQVDTENPKTSRDYYERGLKREKVKQYQEALADYQKAADLDPQSYGVHFSSSSMRAELKDYAGAISDLNTCLVARPKDYSALFNRGLYHDWIVSQNRRRQRPFRNARN